MYKVVICFSIILCLISCSSYRTLEGSAKPTYFSAAPELFKDSLYPVLAVTYPTLQGLKGGIVEATEIRPDTSNVTFIRRPTLFNFHQTTLLVNPGEAIHITGSVESPVFTVKNGNEQRNRELNFFRSFQKLRHYPSLPSFIIDHTIDTILNLEALQQKRIAKADLADKSLFDSLAQAERISSRFRTQAWRYLANSNDGSLFWLYSMYKDTLKAHHLYEKKLRSLIPQFNAMANNAAFNYHIENNLNELTRALFPQNHMWSMADEQEFKRCFDSVAQTFTGIPRDYLLSRIMFRANMLGLPIAPAYRKQYQRYNSNNSYRRIVKNAGNEKRRTEKDKSIAPNILVAAKDNKQASLEEIIAKHKGRVVYIDLWASWCQPCIKEMPHLNQLIQKYAQEQVVFISISSDKYSSSWRQAIAKYGLSSEQSYLMLNATKAALYRDYEVITIPRYLLIDKDGKVINADAPAPSDPALSDLINGLIRP